MLAGGGAFSAIIVVFIIWYYFSPSYTDAGYMPDQPVKYSHKLHAGDLGIDCRYCHTSVEEAASARVPPTQTCMNCHTILGTDNEKLLPVRESYATGQPIEWVRIHNIPDYAYFDHSAHINAGVGCQSCHGDIHQMDVVRQVEPLSMEWCLTCHRDPAPHIRPLDQVTNMNWTPGKDHDEYVRRFMEEHDISAPITDCSGCHR